MDAFLTRPVDIISNKIILAETVGFLSSPPVSHPEENPCLDVGPSLNKGRENSERGHSIPEIIDPPWPHSSVNPLEPDVAVVTPTEQGAVGKRKRHEAVAKSKHPSVTSSQSPRKKDSREENGKDGPGAGFAPQSINCCPGQKVKTHFGAITATE
ncbi:hypothetical protein NDU88_001111 [Pleurodeles waltl]|uniref:Uncharacterized protein n=1 Tax=Pleurodeles waltl TaxID=8319 RepID=A0AAV7R645_PLEWA|nr:hypothetical protein NDU88_001111 [Pleurodeles waltl]